MKIIILLLTLPIIFTLFSSVTSGIFIYLGSKGSEILNAARVGGALPGIIGLYRSIKLGWIGEALVCLVYIFLGVIVGEKVGPIGGNVLVQILHSIGSIFK